MTHTTLKTRVLTCSISSSSCCSVLQGVAVCYSVLQCAAVCCSVLQCAAVCCSVLQCAAVCCSVLQRNAACCSVLQRVAACCSVLQRKCSHGARAPQPLHVSCVLRVTQVQRVTSHIEWLVLHKGSSTSSPVMCLVLRVTHMQHQPFTYM